MPSKSGTTQTLLRGAFRYFGLVSDKGVSAPQLQPLVKAKGAERRELWRKLVVKAYPTLFNSKINLENATYGEIAEVFSNEVSSQDTIRKCVTFFSYAAKDAGIKISPHVKPYAGTRSAARQARKRTREVREPISHPEILTDAKRAPDPVELELLLAKFPEFNPDWSDEKIAKWVKAIERIKLMAVDGQGASVISGSEEPPPEDQDDQRQLKLW